MSLSTLRAAAGRIQPRAPDPGPLNGQLPLSVLRTVLDGPSERSQWRLHADGVLGRALMVPAGATVTVPLRLSNEVTFTARAMLLPHDWRDGQGAVRASAAVRAGDGRERALWSGVLRAADRGRPRGLRVVCALPAWSRALKLTVEGSPDSRARTVARAIWVSPAIVDPSGPAPPPARAPIEASTPPTGLDPLISVLIPVHDPPVQMLEDAIASVRKQTFTGWELCLVDDGSRNAEIIAALERHSAADPRIRLSRRDQAGGISAATNAALELATGEYIALLDHDDTLVPNALQQIADQIAAQPDLDMIYSDEDVVGEAGLIELHPKPGWSPEHMAALMYTCHLGVYRRTLAIELGGFESRFDGCQDYDFVLRLIEHTDRVAHVPDTLYHWRAHPASTAGGDAKPHAYLLQRGAISNHLRRTGVDAEVQFAHHPGLHRIVHRVDSSVSVDLVLVVNDGRAVAEAASSWLAQPHSAWNVLIAGPRHVLDVARAALATAGIPDSRVTTVSTGSEQRPAHALAAAAQAACAEHLVIMQTPAIGLTHDWLTRLIGYSNQPQIGAAGPVVLAPDGRIQQAGIALPEGIPLHLHHGSPAAAAQPVVYNVSAVSGVLATRRDIYQRLGGLDPEFNELALIHYCLRATDTGHRIVIVPDARLRTTGPDQTTNDLPTIWRLRNAWAQTHTHDPYYNPNYRTDRGDFIVAP